MGAPMGRNLLKAGHQVTVWNRTRERARADGRALTVRRDTWPEQIHRDRPSMIADAFHRTAGLTCFRNNGVHQALDESQRTVLDNVLGHFRPLRPPDEPKRRGSPTLRSERVVHPDSVELG